MWATWIGHRTPQFKTHTSLGLCKSAISGKMRDDTLPCDAYVYSWDDDMAEWDERFFLAKGTDKNSSRLYQTMIPRGRREEKPASQEEIDRAIASLSEPAQNKRIKRAKR